jgi:hypothetical protein
MMWFPSSAAAVTFAAVSPGSSDRLFAKNITRVRSSTPNGMFAVGANGSAMCVTDSKASARVELGFVSRTGALAICPLEGTSSAMQRSAKKRKSGKAGRLETK